MIYSRQTLWTVVVLVLVAVFVALPLIFAPDGTLGLTPVLANALLIERRQKRGQLVDQMRKILQKADTEGKRALTAEEAQEYDRVDKEQERLGQEIVREERLAAVEGELSQRPNPTARPQPGDDATARALIPERFRSVYDQASPEIRGRLVVLASPGYRDGYRQWLRDQSMAGFVTGEARNTLQMDLFTKGGALVAPLELVAELIKASDDEVFIRQFARKFTVTMAEGLGVPTLDTDPADADWTSELKVGNQATMAFGRRELRPHPLAKWIKVSNKLIRASGFPIESLVTGRLGYKFGITQEKAFMTGSGVQQPLGIFTASGDGIDTGRDVSTGNSATEIGADGLIEAKHKVKAAYWPRLRWAFHRDSVKQIRKLKDGNGQYLWAPGLTGGIPDRILESPYSVSEYAPNTFTTGLYVGIIGDFSQYWIVDALEMTIQRLVELYAATNETGFIGREEVDGAPVLAEAFARVKLA